MRAPAIDVLFRPEQKHGLSRKDDIVVPVASRYGNMDDSLRPEKSAFFHIEVHLVIAAAAGGVNACVPVQHRWDAQGIPDAVAVPCTLAGSNRKGGGHSGKWSGSPQFAILLENKSVGVS